MKNSICIVGLINDFTKKIAKALADELEMFYADVNELLQFDLIDINEAQKKSGKNYILKLETSKVKTVSTYENTVFTLNYSSLINNNNYEYVKENSLIIYLKLGEKTFLKVLENQNLTKNQKHLQAVVFKDRDKLCNKICDIKISVRSLDEKVIIKNLIYALQEYYKGI